VLCLREIVVPHEVDGHVVGRLERRQERIGAGRRETRDPVEADEPLEQDDAVTDLVQSSTSGAARELGVLTGCQLLVAFAGELHHAL
jgi:translation elongation factor EF-G